MKPVAVMALAAAAATAAAPIDSRFFLPCLSEGAYASLILAFFSLEFSLAY